MTAGILHWQTEYPALNAHVETLGMSDQRWLNGRCSLSSFPRWHLTPQMPAVLPPIVHADCPCLWHQFWPLQGSLREPWSALLGW